MPAIGLRIDKSGQKSFVISYTARGRRRIYTLGRYGRITLHQARDAAMEAFLLMHRGGDPTGDRNAGREAPTMVDLGKRYVRDQANPVDGVRQSYCHGQRRKPSPRASTTVPSAPPST